MKLSELTVRFIDLFVPPGYLELQQYDVILRSRITVSFLLLSSLACFASGFIAPAVDGLQSDFFRLSHIGVYFSSLAFLFNILVFRLTGYFFITANLYGMTSFLVLYFVTPVLGGPLQNPLELLVIIVPTLIFLMAGRYMGFFWTGVILLYFFMTPMIGAQPKAIRLAPDLYNFLQITTWSILSVAFFIIIYIFDLLNAKLRHVLSVESSSFEFEARHDKLTGILNRSCFQLRLDRCLDRIKMNNSAAVIGLLDLDGFKPINDEIGHHAGDFVLKEVALRLQAIIRKTDTLARLGGDEFAFILEDMHDAEAVERTVRAMLKAIAEPFPVEGKIVQISGSIGLARCPEDCTEPEDILRAADISMYEAKKEKGCFKHFKDVPHKSRPRRIGSRFG